MIQFKMPPCCSCCLADEATQSWRIESETTAVGDNGKNISRFNWVHVPLCSKCHRHLWLQCWLFALVGIVLGAVATGMMLHYGPQLLANYRVLSPRFMAVMTIGSGGIIAWGVGYTLRKGLVDGALAIYQHKEGRIVFGNQRFQELFDEANPYVRKTRRSSLGI
ncbi:MAG: hypothetical protein L0211_11835 [Planctomycetaceae bacterium]|nr:hypothetical protein [Planctomycetaceae bacterium]